ncbi:AraC family transcriptional regulator [[Clostridium] scindens]|uniref:helix-turn-helix transcriptional regulator n=1 Tax=Clostridium scindens (strain JCM 10418 / VPI 12708) TaxID=29347 RepID=UPI00298BCACA|nr:AraC family transcriptional regulator [[Clostridium] scindens]WPB39437.1 HTH-type transcriptional activator RhaS [[Clostridium] scindens]
MNKNMITIQKVGHYRHQHVLTHWQEEPELIHVVEGYIYCLIDGKEYRLAPGDICMIHSHHLHSMYCNTEHAGTFRSLLIEPALLTSHPQVLETYIDPIIIHMSVSHMIISSDKIITREIVQLMDTIQLLESKTFPAYELLLIAYLHMIFQKLYVLYQSMDSIQNKPFEEHIALYRHMASYIYENYMDRLSIDDLADVVHISRNKCYHLFKKYTQQSPMEFVNRYRLEVSTNLLAYTMNSLASIAAACGFCHQSYFGKLFLRQYGMTPLEYRKYHQHQQEP